MNLLKRWIGSPSPASNLTSPAERDLTPEARLICAAFWIVLGREVQPLELRDEARDFRLDDMHGFLRRLLTSAEFRQGLTHWKAGRSRGDRVAEDRALDQLGSNEWFVARAYEFLLLRRADDEGLHHHIGLLDAGEPRSHVLQGMALSEECALRLEEIAPQSGFVPRDCQLCELANPAKWDNPEWMRILEELKVVPRDKESMHRKGYEFTQLLYGLERLGRLHEGTDVISIGAGHEAILYWLANRVGSVVATDLYEEGRWDSTGAREGDERVVQWPEDFAPFPYRTDRLVFLKMDGRHLAFRSATFDVAYSLSSIEHFGGLAGAQSAVDEMMRVLKPGGLLVLATEYMLSGARHDEVFTPAGVHALIARPGLRLVQPIDELVYQRYEYKAVDLYKNRFQTPHMVVQMGETVFTTVMMFLEKTSG
jgi:SAM-dependent methyltransferase